MVMNTAGLEARYRQRLVRRSPTYSRLPVLILILLAGLLAWEITRVNVPSPAQISGLPWRVSLVGVDTAATLTGGLAALIAARNQFAVAGRPHLGTPLRAAPSYLLPSGDFTTWIFNAGPGVAKIQSVDYAITVRDTGWPLEWLDYHEAREVLTGLGLVEGEHYGLSWTTGDFPLTASKSVEDGVELITFSYELIDILDRLDIRVRVVDPVNDEHEKIAGVLYHLPARFLL